MLEVEEALAGILPGSAPTPARNQEHRVDVRRLGCGQVFGNGIAHFQRPRLGGPGRQAELNLHPPLVLARNEAPWQPHEEQGQQSEHQRIDGEEQPLAVHHFADGANVAVQHPVEGAVEPVLRALERPADAAARLGFRPMRRRLEQSGGERRAENERHEDREDHGRNDGQRELAVDHAGRAPEERHRHEHRRKHQSDRNERDLQLSHRFDGRFSRSHPRVLVHQPLDVLDDHDRVVDEQADGYDQPEQSQRVDRKAGEIEHGEGPQQNHGDRDCGYQRRTPALQEHEHHDHHEDDRFEQRLHHLVDRKPDKRGRIVGVGVAEAFREVSAQFLHHGLHRVGGSQRIGPRRERDRHPRAGVAVHLHDRVVALRADFDPGHVLQADDRAVALRLDQDVLELFGGLEPPLGFDRGVEHLVVGRRLAADLACRDFGVLGVDCVDHIVRNQRERGQPVRIEPYPHRVGRSENVDVAHTVDARQCVLDVRGQIVRHVLVRTGVGGVEHADHQQHVRVRLGYRHALALHVLRQPRQGLLHAILHLDLGNVGVGALGERHRDVRTAARIGARAEVEQAVDAGELLLQDLGDAVFDRFGGGAGIARADVDLGRRDIRVLFDRQLGQRADAEQHDDDRQHPGEDRPIDEDA